MTLPRTLLYGVYALDVDLTGSRLGPEFYSVRCVVEWDGDADDLRRCAATHFAVPLENVGSSRLDEPEAGE